MTLGNMRAMRIYVVVPTLLLAPLGIGAAAEPDRITCTGILTEAETRTTAWPLGVIQDTGGHYLCTIDRAASGRDLIKGCAVGDKCRVIGTFHKVGQIYSIQTIISADRAE
jgi:hypothetical protein